MKKRIYIAGPITQGILSVSVNNATAAFITLAKMGYAPFCPHWSVYAKQCDNAKIVHGEGMPMPDWDRCVCIGTKNGNTEMSHDDWLGVDLAWVCCSDAVLRLAGPSRGADAECDLARSLNIPVFASMTELFTSIPPQTSAA